MSKPNFTALFELSELSKWVVEFTVCGTILLVLLGLLSLLCNRSSAAARHAVWVSGLVMLLLLPLSLKLLPRLHVLPGLSKPAAEAATASHGGLPLLTQNPPRGSFDSVHRRYAEGAPLPAPPLKATDVEVSDPERVTPTRSQSNSPASGSSAESYDGSLNFTKILALTWLAGAAFCILRLSASLVWLRRLTRGSRCTSVSEMVEKNAEVCASNLGLRQQVRVILTNREIMPMAWGVLCPSVLLPESIAAKGTTDCRTILLHELGHIRRRDPLWHLLTELAGIFFWFHPLFWYSRRQCAAMREIACDDLVLNLGVPQDTYARCLLEIVARRRDFAPACTVGVAMSASLRIENRIRTIMSQSENRAPLGQRPALLLVVSALGALLPLCMLRAENPSVDPPTRTKQSEKSAEAPVPAEDGRMEPRTASGRVVDTDGLPIPDALLLTTSYSADRERLSVASRTDRSGNFELTFPASTSQWDITWIHADGYALQGVMMKHAFADDAKAENIELRLREPDPERLQFRNPDGSPCDDALVIPRSVRIYAGRFIDGIFALDESNVISPLPDELVERVGRRTDQNGEVRLTAMSRDQFGNVDVRTQEYGTQRFWIRGDKDELRLSPVGEIRGRVLMDSPELVAGTKVWIESSSPASESVGVAAVEFDESGRFHVPAIVPGGRLSVMMDWDETLPLHPVLEPVHRGDFVTDTVLDLAIETRPAVKVNGQVLTADTREPVVGARAFLNSLSSPLNGFHAITDNQGNFSLRVAPGVAIQQVTSMGDDVSLYDRYDYPRVGRLKIPADVEELDLEPFLLPPKQIVRGRLYDGARRPIGGAAVIFHTVDRMRVTAEAVTEADGGFMTPVPEWAIIQGNPQIAERYRWSILHDDKAEAGYRKRTTTPLNMTRDEAGELVLERP